MSYMTQLLGAKELHSFVAYSFLVYHYAYGTEVDIWPADYYQDVFVHFLLTTKLNTYRIIRMQYTIFQKEWTKILGNR
jgi:hypothetical protein